MIKGRTATPWPELIGVILTLAVLAFMASIQGGCKSQSPTVRLPRQVQPIAAGAPISQKVRDLMEAGWSIWGMDGDTLVLVKKEPHGDDIFYDFDKATIEDDQMLNSIANSAGLLMTEFARVVVVGHADKRGTVRYNLTLGLERAQALADIYVEGGIPPKMISLTSLGKSSPVCLENTESCHARNRRVETFVYLEREVTRHDHER